MPPIVRCYLVLILAAQCSAEEINSTINENYIESNTISSTGSNEHDTIGNQSDSSILWTVSPEVTSLPEVTTSPETIPGDGGDAEPINPDDTGGISSEEQAASNPDDVSTGALAQVSPSFKPFNPFAAPTCFSKANPSGAFILPTCAALDIWYDPLIVSSRSAVVEVRQSVSLKINISAFRDATYRSSLGINSVNGLVGVVTNSTLRVAPQSICDQSIISLLKFLWDDPSAFKLFNADLPTGFLEESDGGPIRASDCTRLGVYGLKLLSAVDRYHKDCFAACIEKDELSHCGFRQKLGEYDRALNDLSDPSSSPAINRLRKCPAAGWLPRNASNTTLDVLAMCASSDSCAALCSGQALPDRAAARRAEYAEIHALAAPSPGSSLRSLSSVLHFVRPISVTLARIALDFPSTGPLDVARRLDALANPVTGRCRAYDRTIADAVLATGPSRRAAGEAPSLLAGLAPSSSMLAVRAVRDPPCLAALDRLERLCTTKAAAFLCARSFAPDVADRGAFTSCTNEGLGDYFPAVKEFNQRCVRLGFPERPTYGPPGRYLLPRDGGRIHMRECFVDYMPYLHAYIGVGLSMWAVAMVSLAVAQRRGLQWLSSSDVTMDVCRSRSFSVAGTLWLLYTFYLFYTLFLSKVDLKICSTGLTGATGLCSTYFPTVLYLFLVAFIWVAAFGWLMAGNNPYRKHPALWSGSGLLLSHGLTLVIVVRLLDKIDLDRGESVGEVYSRSYEILLLCALQGAVDATYLLHLCLWPALRKNSFHKTRNEEHTKYIHGILDREAGQELVNRFGDCISVSVTCAYDAAAELPKAMDVQAVLADATEKSRDCFIVVSVVPAQATAEHGRQAQRRGLDIHASKLCVAEVIIAKLCLTEQEEEVRWALFEEEAGRAKVDGRAADYARFRVEQARLSKPFPRMGLQDAMILTQNLKSDLFKQAIQEEIAEIYWSSTAAALREFLRLAGNRLPERSSTETREKFRAIATSVGLTKFCISVLCSSSESVLRTKLYDLQESVSQQTGDVLAKLSSLSRTMLDDGRRGLITLLEDSNFLEFMKQSVSDVGSKNQCTRNPFSLQTSCLDAFHFEHFKNSTQNSKYRSSSPAAKILQSLSLQIQNTLLQQEVRLPLQYVVSISRRDSGESDEESKTMFIKSKKSAFLPSVLFICVGIAAIITSNLFVNSVASGVRYRDLLYSATNTVKDLQAFAGYFATATLDLMTCIDPDLVQNLKKLSPAQYAAQLKSWPPLMNAITTVSHDPSILGTSLEVQKMVLGSVEEAIPNLMTDIVTLSIQTMSSSLASGSTSLQAAAATATVTAQQAAVKAISELIANETRNSQVIGLVAAFPSLIAPAVERQMINLSRPEIVATLPVVGPTLACLSSILSSSNVQSVVQQGIEYTNGLKIPKVSFLKSVSADPCRENLDKDDCSEQWKQVYPASAAARKQLYHLSLQSPNKLPAFMFSMLNTTAKPYSVSKSCQYYESLGCSSVATLTAQTRSVAGWGGFVNSTRELIDSYMSPLNDTLNYATDYARRTVLPCFITGHVLAFVSAMIMTCNVLYQFQRRLIEMREGKQPYQYVFQKTNPSTFSSTSTPTLGGMVLATAYAQYYVWAYLIFIVLVVVTSEKFYELIFLVGGVWILIEVAVGYIIARVVLERMIGKNMIFGGTGDMQHPVVWTWYSTYLLIVNIIKGLLAGIVRMILMIIMLVLQIGVMDRSNFPEGQESQDPAFVSFLSTLLFHHRYRNPLFTAFAHKYEEHAEKKKAEGATSEDPEKPDSALNSTSQQKRGNVRRRFLLAHTLRCNPRLAEYISDQEVRKKDHSAHKKTGQDSLQNINVQDGAEHEFVGCHGGRKESTSVPPVPAVSTAADPSDPVKAAGRTEDVDPPALVQYNTYGSEGWIPWIEPLPTLTEPSAGQYDPPLLFPAQRM